MERGDAEWHFSRPTSGQRLRVLGTGSGSFVWRWLAARPHWSSVHGDEDHSRGQGSRPRNTRHERLGRVLLSQVGRKFKLVRAGNKMRLKWQKMQLHLSSKFKSSFTSVFGDVSLIVMDGHTGGWTDGRSRPLIGMRILITLASFCVYFSPPFLPWFDGIRIETPNAFCFLGWNEMVCWSVLTKRRPRCA